MLPKSKQHIQQVIRLMGNRFEITVVATDEQWANEKIQLAIEEIQRIENLLSTFKEDSETNKINKLAGIAAVSVSLETIQLILRAQKISNLTQGAFDISYGSMDKRFWNFDQTMTELPSKSDAQNLVRLINYKNIIVDELAQTVFLKEKGMRIGFGGIGKGYAAERAKMILKNEGVESGIVNASGDLTTWGTQADGTDWTVGIAHPDYKNVAFSALKLKDAAIATSGNYEKFVMINGQKYSHTINPKTGYPIKGIKSVSIICNNAEIADAMATPISIMGVTVGLGLINQIKGMSCIIIDDDNKMYSSKNINLL